MENIFKEFNLEDETITNYELYLRPRGIYKIKNLICDNYLYPVYATKINDKVYYSTSVYQLILKKKNFIRNPYFQTTDFYRPTFQTIDKEVYRVRTLPRESDETLSNPKIIAEKSAKIFQKYITEIEEKFKDHKHLLLMGGKDSQNYLLANRKSSWIVLSGQPNADLNEKFIKDNNIKNIEEFIKHEDIANNEMLLDEITASDCFFDVGHFRYIPKIAEIIKKNNGKVVVWYGQAGDGKFVYCANHRHPNFFDVHVLHVGMAMGILHQLSKNLFDVPALSIYQCPEFLEEIFFKFEPYFVKDLKYDLRIDIGKILFNGIEPIYPKLNPSPSDWSDIVYRNRKKSIGRYINSLQKKEIHIDRYFILSFYNKYKEWLIHRINWHSVKNRTPISKILYPLRKFLSKYFKIFKIKRYNIREI